MEKLSTRQTKTLDRLKELMGAIDFQLKYIASKGNILADFTSHYLYKSVQAIIAVTTIGQSSKASKEAQASWGLWRAL